MLPRSHNSTHIQRLKKTERRRYNFAASTHKMSLNPRTGPVTGYSNYNLTELVQLARYWRHRYLLEVCSPFLPNEVILNPDEIITLMDPVFHQGTLNDVAITLQDFLDHDMAFFEDIQQRLALVVRVWDTILSHKRRHNSFNTISLWGQRELMEAMMICGKLIPGRMGFVPVPPIMFPESFSYERADNSFQEALNPSQEITPFFVRPSDIMQVDSTNPEDSGSSAHLTCSSTAAQEGCGSKTTPTLTNRNKRTIEDRDGYDDHDDGPPRKKARKSRRGRLSRTENDARLRPLLPKPPEP